MSDGYVGEIRMFAGSYAPQGWAFCDGSLLPISGNETLFALLGVTYGGDGASTFALPDLRGRFPRGQGTLDERGSTVTMGQKGGTETVALTSQQMPAHTHPPVAHGAADRTEPEGAVWAEGEHSGFSAAGDRAALAEDAVGLAGGGAAHENMPPYVAINFIIAREGVYPSRP